MAREQHAPSRFDVREPTLQPASGVALYAQLAELFRYQIASRKWASGLRLANFDDLAAQYGVARITVRQAVALLVKEGLLSTQRGRGTFVLTEPVRLPPAAAGDADEQLEMEILFSARTTQLPSEFQLIVTIGGGEFACVELHEERCEPPSRRRTPREGETTMLRGLASTYVHTRGASF